MPIFPMCVMLHGPMHTQSDAYRAERQPDVPDKKIKQERYADVRKAN